MSDGFGDGSNGGYSPDKFYTASRNTKGFTSTLRMNVPPEVVAWIGQIVQSGAIPEIRTREDFFRDALIHELHRTQEFIDNGVLSAEQIALREQMMREAEVERVKIHLMSIGRIVDSSREIESLARNAAGTDKSQSLTTLRAVLTTSNLSNAEKESLQRAINELER